MRKRDAYNKNTHLKCVIKLKGRGDMRVDAFKIRLLLAKKDMLIKDLAKESHVSRQTISYILAGKSCSMQVLYKIASALGVDPEQIAVREELNE